MCKNKHTDIRPDDTDTQTHEVKVTMQGGMFRVISFGLASFSSCFECFCERVSSDLTSPPALRFEPPLFRIPTVDTGPESAASVNGIGFGSAAELIAGTATAEAAGADAAGAGLDSEGLCTLAAAAA